MNVYDKCPILKNNRFILRQTGLKDVVDLLKVYSDEKAMPLFNSDNCVDDFKYTTVERMKQAIEFWNDEYKRKYYVRWSIIDKETNCAIGTIELFNRKADDYFNNCSLLRLDLRSDYEQAEIIRKILEIIIPKTKELFDCAFIATKAIPKAEERIKTLISMGFTASKEKLVGHKGELYGDYWVL